MLKLFVCPASSVVWDGADQADNNTVLVYAVLIYADSEHQKLDAIYSVGGLTNEELESCKYRFEGKYKGMYHPIFVAENTLPKDLKSEVVFADLCKKFEARQLSEGRSKPILLAIECANTVRNHTGRSGCNIDVDKLREQCSDNNFATVIREIMPSFFAATENKPPMVHSVASGKGHRQTVSSPCAYKFRAVSSVEQGADIEIGRLVCRHRRTLYSNPKVLPRPIFSSQNAPNG